MKTRIGLVALVLIILTTLSSSVNAHKYNCKASGHEKMVEQPLDVESWMLNEKVWDLNQSFVLSSEMDETLEIEKWMMDSFSFETLASKDECLEIESWMIDNESWNMIVISSVENESVAENSLVVENWMTDNVRWNTVR